MKNPNNTLILKVLVGSRAHGLHTEDSDYDWRGVFVTPTSDILKIGGHNDQTNWIEGKEDDTSWEIGKFLLMATKCNPTVLEVFKAPQEKLINGVQSLADKLQALFPQVWNSTDVMNAFVGYGLNQRKKFLENKDDRSHKYAVAYLRTLYQANELLLTGDMPVNMSSTSVFQTLKRWKNKECEVGEVIQLTHEWEQRVRKAYEKNPDKQTNMDIVNNFLLDIRREFWV